MRDTPRIIAVVLCCFCLTSCWAPEEFTATLNVDQNKNFQFTYDGTVAFGLALAQIEGRGPLSPADEAEMKKGEADLRRTSGFAKADYIGRGRFRVQYREAGPIHSGKKAFLDLVEFRVDPGGLIRILGPEIPAEGRQQLRALALKLNGIIKVTTDLTVVEQNATSLPWFGGLIGSYQWQVTLDRTERPAILLQ
ncbi:MAG: hypothetical protein Q7R30_18630 [Acidobacteriota bacterium]|nr:hypothetical protein [Acidobacteriota bacterium]